PPQASATPLAASAVEPVLQVCGKQRDRIAHEEIDDGDLRKDDEGIEGRRNQEHAAERQFLNGYDRKQGGVLEQRQEIVDGRGQDIAKGLGQDDEAERLEVGQADGRRGLTLRRRHGFYAAAKNL